MATGKNNRKLDFEELWKLVGGFGRYPILLTAFMMYVTAVVSFHIFVQTFYGTAPNYKCISHDPNKTSLCTVNKCGCHNCTYVFSDEFTSAVSEWNLICERAHLKAMTQSSFMAGLLIGSLGFGKFSDHFGRKPTTFLSLLLMVVFGFGSTFANSLTLFSVMRFGSGFSTSGIMLTKFVYCMEISRLPHRTTMGIICNFFIVIGALVLVLMAYYLRDWRDLMLAVTLSGIPSLLFWRWITESPRWLIAKGKLKDAREVFERFAAANGVQVDSKTLDLTIRGIKNAETQIHVCNKKNMSGILDLIRTPRMRKRSLVLAYNWFVNSAVFFGITLNAKNLGGSFYLNVFILFSVGIPSTISLWYVLKRFGRRLSYCCYMLLGGIACFMVIAVPGSSGRDFSAVKVLAVIGIFCIIATFSGVYIYNLELSPTLLRNLSLGVGSMLSRIGGIVAPYVVFLNDIMPNLPLIVFGAMSFIAGITALFLPETLFSPMPQTVQQVESWDEDYSIPWRIKNVRKQISKISHSEQEVDFDLNYLPASNKRKDICFHETTV